MPTSSRSEKPWSNSSSSNHSRKINDEDDEETAIDLQISRNAVGVATTKKQSSIDAHFVSDRMQKRKDMYRGIIKGDYDFVVDGVDVSRHSGGKGSSSSPEELIDDVEYSLHVLSQQESTTSLASDRTRSDEGYVVMSEQARQARQRRLANGSAVVVGPTGTATTTSSTASVSTVDSDALTARSLRAQRLRQVQKENLQQDEDMAEKLRLRRIEQAEQDRRLQKEQAEQEEKTRLEEERLAHQRALIAEERRMLEQEKRKQARELEARQREFTLQVEAKKKVKKARAKADPPGDYSLIQEVQMLVRESGVFKTCVSSCFGDDDEGLLSSSGRKDTKSSHQEPPSLTNASRYQSSPLLSLGSGLSDLRLDESGNNPTTTTNISKTD